MDRRRFVTDICLLEVNDIHQKVALLLQVESETAGRTEAWLPRDRFYKLVRTQLAAEEFEGRGVGETRAGDHGGCIAAVGLPCRAPADRIGFEIRSPHEEKVLDTSLTG